MDGPNLLLVILVAFALGLRHALDPDHLIAVSTLVAGAGEAKPPRAGRLGATWGAGHALAVVAFGLPIIFAHTFLPEIVRRLAETAVGVVIVLLALGILRRWRQGRYHLHEHEHAGMRHRHVHNHDEGPRHAHEHRPRTPLQAFLIGITHGVGGSAAVTLLLLASIPDRAWASIALVVFAVGTAVSMGVASAAFAWVLELEPLKPRIRLVIVPLGVAACAFGILYAAAAWTQLA